MSLRKLPDDVIRKIRSGVAIVSICHCMEELVLNALDAGATCIAVRLNLPYHKVQVVDNGHGMTYSQLVKCGERYSTSKCHSIEDLENPKYYGYRGEALASLSEMSGALEIESRASNSSKTYYKAYIHGKKKEVKEAIAPRASAGTTITVQDFMYNMPVRKRAVFESLTFEFCLQHLEGIALIHPTVSFTLRNDTTGEKCLQTYKSNSILASFEQMFGKSKVDSFTKYSSRKDDLKIKAYFCLEGHTTKRFQFVYVNKRLVLKTKIHKLLTNIFRKYVFSRCGTRARFDILSSPLKQKIQHSVFIVSLSCPPKLCDVTFEPQKTLVEFRNWDIVNSSFERILNHFLKDHGMIENDIVISGEMGYSMQASPKKVNNSPHPHADKNEAKNINVGEIKNALISLRARKNVRFETSPEYLKTPSTDNDDCLESSPVNMNNSLHDQHCLSEISEDDEDPLHVSKSSNCQGRKVLTEEDSSSRSSSQDTPDTTIPDETDNNEFLNMLQNKFHINPIALPQFFSHSSVRVKRLKTKYSKKECLSNIKDKFRFNKSDRPLRSYVHNVKKESLQNKSKREVLIQNFRNKMKHADEIQMGLAETTSVENETPVKPSKGNKALLSSCNPSNKVGNLHSTPPSSLSSEKKECSHTVKDKLFMKQPDSFLTKPDFGEKQNSSIENVFLQENDQDRVRINSSPDFSSCIEPNPELVSEERTDLLNSYFVNLKGSEEKKSIPFALKLSLKYKKSKSICLPDELLKNKQTNEEKCFKSHGVQVNSGVVHNSISKSKTHDLPLTETVHLVDDGTFLIPNKKLKLAEDSSPLDKSCDNSQIAQFLTQPFKPTSIPESIHSSSSKETAEDNIQVNENSPHPAIKTICSNALTCDGDHIMDKNLCEVLPTSSAYSLDSQIFSLPPDSICLSTLDFSPMDSHTLDQDKLFVFKQYLKDLNSENYSKPACAVEESPPEDLICGQRCSHSEVLSDSYSPHSEPLFTPVYPDIEDQYFKETANSSERALDQNTQSKQISSENVALSCEKDLLENKCTNDNPEESRNSTFTEVQETGQDNCLTKDVVLKLNSKETTVARSLLEENYATTTGESASDAIQMDNIEDDSKNKVQSIGKDWICLRDSTSGKNVFINTISGNSTYNTPLYEEGKEITQIPTKEDEAKLNFVLVHNKTPFVPRPVSERTQFSNLEECDSSNIADLLKNWKNPVFQNASLDANIQRKKPAALVYDITHTYKFRKEMLERLQVIGQVDKKFIACVMPVCENTSMKDNSLIVVFDQHAAHERVRLEQIIADNKKQMKTSKVQPSMALSLEPDLMRQVARLKDEIFQLGFHYSVSKSEIVVDRIPACLLERVHSENRSRRNVSLALLIEEVLREYADLLINTKGGCTSYPQTLHGIFCSQACRGAVKFGDDLTLEDCKHILQCLSTCNLPFQCAHGRPSVIPVLDLRHLDYKRPEKPALWKLCKRMSSQNS